jgi:membrane glycosyltransferase
VVDPSLNALVCAHGVARREPPAAVVREREAILTRALQGGLAALRPVERAALIADPIALSRLHRDVWSDPAADAAWSDARVAARPALPRSWLPQAPAAAVQRPAA